MADMATVLPLDAFYSFGWLRGRGLVQHLSAFYPTNPAGFYARSAVDVTTISRDLLLRYIKDALGRFYDPAYLQSHPLAECLGAVGSPRGVAGLALRELLADAIESLRPDASIPHDHREWLSYRLMRSRYISAAGVNEVCRELGVGRTTFYVHHSEALEAISDLLWERCQRLASNEEAAPNQESGLICDGSAEQEAVRLASESIREWTDIASALDAVEDIIHPLLIQQGTALRVRVSTSLPPAYVAPAMLHQMLIVLLSEAILVAEGDLTLCVSATNDETLWELMYLDSTRLESSKPEQTPRLAVVLGLLQAYGGRMWVEETQPGLATLYLSLPVALPATLLVVDDDPDASALYRRYFQKRNWVILGARNKAELQRHLVEGTPDLILLDVLMPEEDGWTILRDLKDDPRTAGVPVVICSVLSQPRLALALGATVVLQKPIDQRLLTETVERLLAHEHNLSIRRPATPADTESP